MSALPLRLDRIRVPLTCLVLLVVALAAASPALAEEPPSPPLRALSAAGEGREMYPPFDPATYHYATGCGAGTLTLSLSAADADTQVAVNGVRVPGSDAAIELSGLTGDSDIAIDLADAAGRRATYTIHCLPDNFPTITARKSAAASDILIGMTAYGQNERFIAILDTNGVPRFHGVGGPGIRSFRYHRDGRYPYSESVRQTGDQLDDRFVVVYDWDMRVVDVVRPVAPVSLLNAHDFVIKPNGNYVLMSYEPTRRDFSAFSDPDGNAYSTDEPTRDSVIQEVTPGGEQVFLWNSWDHLAVGEDCRQHRFPDDYAHINSLQVVDGDIVASFRGCSQVLRIDGTTGDIVWLLGKSNRSDADWIANGAPAPLSIAGDPHGEFCGQHAARMKPNGNLVLFDNGSACLVDPATGTSERASGVFSRVVEYSLDPDSGRVLFLRHHSLHGTFDRYSHALGHVELLQNGNWLVSWGRGLSDDDPETALPPDESITEVNPLTGEELLSITMSDGDMVLATRAYPLPADALERRPTAPLTELEPGWNRIVWRGRDGIPMEEALKGSASVEGKGVTAIHTRDAETGAWLSFFPNAAASPGVNTLAAFTEGRTYWAFARERVRWTIPQAEASPRD